MTDNEGIFGIDLGTTYSAVAYIDQTGRPTVVRNGAGHETTPSVVHFENESNVVVGQVAKESAVISPDEVVSLVKREMGNRDYVRRMFGKEYTAPAISALILDALARSAEAETGRKAGKIVITVPAYFGMLEKEATRQAGQIAGLNVIGIVPEPVAAALAYGLGGDADGKTILVYDLGGGTFDVTIMRIGTAEIEVLVVGGDHKLGGADWDEMLFNHLVAEVSGQVGDDSILDDDHLVQEIWNLAEKTKKELSEAETRPAIIRHSGGSAKITVSRAQFEQLTAHLVQQTIDITERTLAEAEGLYPGVEAEITDVLLVGGSSKMPAVSAAISRAFGWVPRLADPDLAVAKGAALYAAGRVVQEIVDRSAPVSGSTAAANSSQSPDLDADSLTAAQVEEIEKVVGLEAATAVEIGKREVVNALPKAVGIKLIDTEVPNWEQLQPMPTYIRHLVHAQTPLPYKSADPYLAATVMPNQDEIEIEIWEQAGAVAGREIHENTFLPPPGHIKNLAGSRLPAGSRIDVHFDVSLEGIVRVRAVEPTSGNDVTVEARIALLSDTQMEQAKAIAAGVTVTT